MEWWDPWDDDPAAFLAGFTAGTVWAGFPAHAADAAAIWEAQRGPIVWPILGWFERRPWDAGFVLAVYGVIALAELGPNACSGVPA